MACGLSEREAMEHLENEEKLRPKPVEQPIEEEEPDIEETEPSELDNLKLENEQKKSEILDKIESQVDSEDKKSEFLKAVESDPSAFRMVMMVLSCLHSFGEPKYAQVGKILVVMERVGDKINFHFEIYNKDGSETMFDPQTGEVVTIFKTEAK